MLSYDLVEDSMVGKHTVYRVWLDGVNAETGKATNKNHQPVTTGWYAGRIVDLGYGWIAIPSFADEGDPYTEVEVDLDDLMVYSVYKTRKKAINKLRQLMNQRLAEINAMA